MTKSEELKKISANLQKIEDLKKKSAELKKPHIEPRKRQNENSGSDISQTISENKEESISPENSNSFSTIFRVKICPVFWIQFIFAKITKSLFYDFFVFFINPLTPSSSFWVQGKLHKNTVIAANLKNQ